MSAVRFHYEYTINFMDGERVVTVTPARPQRGEGYTKFSRGAGALVVETHDEKGYTIYEDLFPWHTIKSVNMQVIERPE
jgi:hypothetical protein